MYHISKYLYSSGIKKNLLPVDMQNTVNRLEGEKGGHGKAKQFLTQIYFFLIYIKPWNFSILLICINASDSSSVAQRGEELISP